MTRLYSLIALALFVLGLAAGTPLYAQVGEDGLIVSAPSGTYRFVEGGALAVRWDSAPASNAVRIDLVAADDQVTPVTEQTEDDGLYLWTVPPSVIDGVGYRLAVTQLDGEAASDTTQFAVQRTARGSASIAPLFGTGNAPRFGESIALSGDGTRAVLGAPNDVFNQLSGGGAFIYEQVGTEWTAVAALAPAERNASSAAGTQVAMSADGQTVLLGAREENSRTGRVYSYVREDSGTWRELAPMHIAQPEPNMYFGTKMKLSADGRYAVVSASLAYGTGSAFLFERSEEGWTELQRLEPPGLGSGTFGQSFYGTGVGMSADASHVVIGGYGLEANRGDAFVFEREGDTWEYKAALAPSTLSGNDRFGYAVDVNAAGTHLAVGAPQGNNTAIDQDGRVYLYERSEEGWVPDTTLAISAQYGNLFGREVSLDAEGDRLLVGTFVRRGLAYLFERTEAGWERSMPIRPDASARSNAYFGDDVMLSADGTVALVGAVSDQRKAYALDLSTLPFLTLESPAMAQSVGVDTGLVIRWMSRGLEQSSIRIELLRESGSVYRTIADGAPDTGSYDWQPDPSLILGTYRIRLSAGSTGRFQDESPFAFTLVPPPPLVINEFLADPAADDDGTPEVEGDANGDMVSDASQDEFIEIFNADDEAVDLSGFTLSDAASGGTVRHTFADGFTLARDQSVVVFGGGSPTNIQTTAVTASTGSLGLSNGGDTITLKNADGVTIAEVVYGDEAGDNQSLARNPDLTGDFVQHTTIPTNPVAFSPGVSNTAGTVLPVELTSFTALASGDAVSLAWTTATETNNDGFAVEQFDGGTFVELGFVAGAGTSLEAQAYTFEVADLDAGTHRFRLKQLDYDGAFSYSAEVEVAVEITGTHSLTAVYPNPFRGTTTFSLSVKAAQDVTVAAYDVLGRRVATLYEGTMEAGASAALTLDASELPAGLYVIRAAGETFVATRTATLVR